MNNLAFHRLSYGIYVLTTQLDGKPFGCIINTAFQITSAPPRIAVSCNKDNYTHDKISNAKMFALSVLTEESSQDLIGTFGYNSGRDIDKFKSYEFTQGDKLSLPLFTDESIATFECKLVESLEVGTHTIFIGEVIDCNVLSNSSNEMTYKYFHEVRKAVAPKNAPTYIEVEKNRDLYECSLCKYVYDEDVPFDELPDDWVCPVCGATKDLFEKT
ncbi:hypothetical protein EW093_11455 [Thiospirochaeta perfilievii]|uniref:Rubredoxin-like domain-containing protein n=1 Tax=Thiospirochaeta perfilievii TaxID=252967 RepID=A0A5C1QGF3_9SPIO|nr:flavin reductase [Thiospirochaeta perfilievii]QEN05302.1 hypothetical protein EW093_11455 [Thiospirochaeta perfilievii]